MICGGEDANVGARAACHYLDPDLVKWIKVDLDVGRKDASSSLFGDRGHMLITGGRKADDKVLESTELLGDGKNCQHKFNEKRIQKRNLRRTRENLVILHIFS